MWQPEAAPPAATAEARPIAAPPGAPEAPAKAETGAYGFRTHHHLVEEQERAHRQDHGSEQECEEIPDRVPGVFRSVATAEMPSG